MSFWLGAMKGLSDWRQQEADRNLQQETLKRQGEEKVALTLLESDDPEVQMAGLSILQAAMQPPTRKKGVRGSLGEYETTEGLAPLLALANRFKGMTEAPTTPTPAASPGGAALPPTSPVQPEAQQGPQPWRFQGQPSTVTPPTFGDVPLAAAGPSLNAPQQFAADASMAHPSGAINMGQIAGRVSRDRGVARPGERGRLFWPTAASRAAAAERARMETKFAVLQALGATPQDLLAAAMAGEGLAQGAARTSGEEWVIVPGQADPVLAFHYSDPRTRQAYMAYTGPDGQPTPLPPGTTRAPSLARAGGAAGGASLTTYMTQEQMLAAGIVSPEDHWPPGLYKVQQKGDQYFVLPYQPPTPPTIATGGGINPATGARQILNPRTGVLEDAPGTAPKVNPRVVAARALIALIGEQERLSGIGTDIAALRQATQGQMRPGQWEALQGLNFEQIKQLALPQIPIDAPDEMLEPILQMVPAPPPGAAGAAPAAPPAGPSSRVPTGDDWGERLADRIIREQQGRMRQSPPGVVRGRGIPPR